MTGCRTMRGCTLRRWMPLLVTMACLVLSGSVRLAAQEGTGGPTLRAAVEDGEWTIGDRIGFRLVLVYPSDLEPALPGVESELGPFLVRDFEDGGRRTLEDGRMEQTWRFWLTAYETGDLEVPPVTVALTGGAQGEQTASSDPVPVRIASVLGEGEEPVDITGLRPPGEIPYSFLPLLLWSLAGMSVLAGLLWFRVWWLARRRVQALQDEAHRLPPRELAIRELQRLTASDLLKHDRFKEFYIAISGIIGRLLHGAVGVVTVERTSWEILRDLRERVPGTPLVRATGEFLEACDRVKFSKYVPGDAENSAVIASAYQLVDLAAPESGVPDAESVQAGTPATSREEG